MKKSKTDLITLTSVLVIAVFANTGAFALSLPGIAPSGTPIFGNNVKVTLNPHNGTIKATGRIALICSSSGVVSPRH